jgi:hypothetical protein
MNVGFGLLACCVLEKNSNDDVLITWAYPAVETQLGQVLITRSGLLESASSTSAANPGAAHSFSRFKNFWLYQFGFKLDGVKAASFALVSESFDPEQYLSVARQLASRYANTGPVGTVTSYLSLFTRGSDDSLNLDNDHRKALLVGTLGELCNALGDEIVLVWSALLLKKRVFIYCDRLVTLLKFIRACPLLIWHRQNWNILRPYCTLSPLEIADLTSAAVYCAGFVDSAAKNREDLYDILIDLNERKVSVATHAKSEFVIGNLHKDLASMLAQANKENDQGLIKELALKTKALLSNLDKMALEQDGRRVVTLEALQARGLPPAMDRFLFSLAQAEGLTKTSA